jgi:hypothetical protein
MSRHLTRLGVDSLMLYMPTALATSCSALTTLSSSIVRVWIWSRLIGVVNDLCSRVISSALILSALFSFVLTSLTSAAVSCDAQPQAVDQAQGWRWPPATTRSEWAASSS